MINMINIINQIVGLSVDFQSIITVIFLIFLLALMMYCYNKIRVFIIIASIEIFSLIIGVLSLTIQLPLQPFISMFFIVFQTCLFLIICIQTFNTERR